MSVRIYRVQHISGAGAYEHAYDQAFDQHDMERTPGAYEDGINVTYGTRFGFASIQQMLAWWNVEQLLDLYDAGCKIAVFDVEDRHVTWGTKQVVFRRTKATLSHYLELDQEHAL